MSYEKGQTVEVRHAGAWRSGRYEREAQAGGAWHDVFVDAMNRTLRFSSDEIRPVPPPAPSFAFGDHVQISVRVPNSCVTDDRKWISGLYAGALPFQHCVYIPTEKRHELAAKDSGFVRPAPQPAKSEPRGWLTIQIVGDKIYDQPDAIKRAEELAAMNPGKKFIAVPIPDKVCVLDAKPEWRDA